MFYQWMKLFDQGYLIYLNEYLWDLSLLFFQNNSLLWMIHFFQKNCHRYFLKLYKLFQQHDYIIELTWFFLLPLLKKNFLGKNFFILTIILLFFNSSFPLNISKSLFLSILLFLFNILIFSFSSSISFFSFLLSFFPS